MIEDLHITSAAIKSPVWLHNKASFLKFGSSGTLISNLKKAPLVFHATSRSAAAEPPCLRGESSFRQACSGPNPSQHRLVCIKLDPRGGFVLPAVIILILVMLMLGFARLSSYRFQAERRIDVQNKTTEMLAVKSGISYLMHGLKTSSTFTGGTNRIPLTNALSFSVAGDGHRFESIVYYKITNEVIRADLTVQDTGQYTNVIVNGLVRLGQ